MEILHTIAGVWEGTGGPAASVPDLCRALADRGHRVTLLTGAGRLAPKVRDATRFEVLTSELGPYRLANWSPAFARACRQAAAGSEIVHNHGLWLHPNWAAASAARGAGKPLVISARGMLEPWSLARSRWRKRLLWRLVERRSFATAAVVHATSAAEAESIRRLGVRTPIAVIPNGVDLDGEFGPARISELRGRAVAPAATPTVLFLSRIHPKKGLPLLLAAWEELAAEFPHARLSIHGPGEPEELRSLAARVARSGGERVDLGGPVAGERKLELLTAAAVLVLPSWSENYGMVIAEALACGTPVITTTETPWREVTARRCGWQVAPRAESVRDALREALEISASERRRMGERGRELIEQEHSLAIAAERMESTYRWALEGGGRPAWFHEAGSG